MKPEIRERIEQIRKGVVPEGYKKTKAGINPKDWDVKQLNYILDHVERKVPKPKKGYWRLGLRSHAKGTFHEFIDDPDTVAMEELFLVAEKDLVVNITFAWEHAIALADKNDAGKLVSHRFPTYVFRENACPNFYKYYVIQPYFKKMLSDISPGGAGRNRVMSKKSFMNLWVHMPPISEQKKIAGVLSIWDKAIKLKERLIAEKKQQKKWLMQNLLTGRKRLPGFTGKWKEIRLGDIGHTYAGLSGKSKEDFGYGKYYIPYNNIYENPVIDVRKLELVNILDNEKQNKVRYGDIFFTTSSETQNEVGMSAVYLGDIDEVYLNSFCMGFRLNDFNTLLPEFACYYFRGLAFRKILYMLAQGAIRFNLSRASLTKISVKLPTISEQTAIAEILSTADREINLHEKQLEELKRQKKALMQLLLTGIVRVREQGVS